MRQSGGDMGQSVCSRTTQHECCLLQSTTKGQSEPDIHEEFDAYLHQLGSFDAYLCPSGRFMSQMTLGAFAVSPHPGVRGFPTCRLLCPIRLSPRTSSFRETLPSHYFPTALGIPRGISRVHRGGLQRDEVGGVLLCVPSALCGSPGLPEDTQVDLCPLLQCF